MLKWLRTIDWLAINTSALVLVLSIQVLSFFSLNEQQQQNPQQSATTETDNFPWYESSAVWTAIFTGLLTFSTIGLWSVTKRAADAAKVAAESLPILERAYLSILPGECDLAQHMDRAKWSPVEIDPVIPRLSWRIANGGRTEAPIDDIRVGFTIGESLPDEPPFMGTPSADYRFQVAYPTDGTDFMETELERSINAADIDQLRGGALFVFFFGCVNYRDIFETDHETVFCFRCRRNGSLEQWGGAKYNYRN